MDNEVFPSANQLPNLIADIVKENTLEALTPGEETWTVPWAIRVDENGILTVNTSMGERGQKPGGTVELKVVSDFDGFIIDATALDRRAIERHFRPRPAGPGSGIVVDDESKYSKVIGILYPDLADTTGLNPKDVRQFNSDQKAARKRFSDYYKKTYGRNYVFASEEANTSRGWRPETLGSVATQRSGRWGRRDR